MPSTCWAPAVREALGRDALSGFCTTWYHALPKLDPLTARANLVKSRHCFTAYTSAASSGCSGVDEEPNCPHFFKVLSVAFNYSLSSSSSTFAWIVNTCFSISSRVIRKLAPVFEFPLPQLKFRSRQSVPGLATQSQIIKYA